MARYVVIQVDDNETADKFVDSINFGVVLHSSRTTDTEYTMVELQPGTAKVVGVYAKPTLFCECTEDKYKDAAQSQKFNWTVCRTCSKARKGWQYPVNMLGDGYQDYLAGKITRMEFYDRRLGFYSTLEGIDHNPIRLARPMPWNENYKGKR